MTHVDRVNRLTATVLKRRRLRRLPEPDSLPIVAEDHMNDKTEARLAAAAKKARAEKLADSTRSAATIHAEICVAVAAGGDKTMMVHALRRAAHLLKLMARKPCTF